MNNAAPAAFEVGYDEEAAAAAGSFSNKPLPAGTYAAAILATKKDGHTIEIVRAANTGPNADKSVLNVRFVILEGQTGAKRNVFARIPLFMKWAPTGQGKYPNGTPAFLFFNFFEALGYKPKERGGIPPITPDLLRSLLGQRVELVLTVEDPDENNPDGSNDVRFINVISDTSFNKTAAPVSRPAVGAAWAPTQNAPVAAAPGGPAWVPNQEAVQAAVPAQQAAPGWSPQQAAPQVQAPAQQADPAQQGAPAGWTPGKGF